MRPSDITDGIPLKRLVPGPSACPCFNEAVGYYRRNHWDRPNGEPTCALQ